MNKPESVLENEMHSILWHFEKKSDHQISARRPVSFIKKKNLPDLVDFAVGTDDTMKVNENKTKQNKKKKTR